MPRRFAARHSFPQPPPAEPPSLSAAANKKGVTLGLTHDHFYKIQMADAVFVYNDVVFVYNKNGYAGDSTTLEIGYAVASGKPIYALSSDEELCRHVLFREIISSPEELVKRLK